MNCRISLTNVAMCLLVMATVMAAGESEFDKPSPQRPLLLKRGNYARGVNKPGSSTTTTTPLPPPLEDDLYDDEEELPIDGGELDELVQPELVETTTTTENPRRFKTGVRPFRSNDDLLAALKRRRAEAASGKIPYNTESSTAAPESFSQSTYHKSHGKKRYQAPKGEHTVQNVEDAPLPVVPSAKPVRGRFSPKIGRLNTAESEISVVETSQPADEPKPRGSYRSNRGRF